MPVSDLEHIKALREADQRAVELLATANAASRNSTIMVTSVLIAIASMLVSLAMVVVMVVKR